LEETMAEEEKKVKKQSKFLLRLIVLILFTIVVVQSYIILKSRKYVKKSIGEKSIVEFVDSEFKKDKENIEEMFESFLKDTKYKGKPLGEMKKEDVEKEIAPVKEKFDKWYIKRFGDERISHTTDLKGSTVIVTVHIPGVKKESVDITIRDDIIKMSGSLKGGEYFNHSILVPKRADAKSSKVDFDAGPNKIRIIFKQS
jgi:HSP20 family molecular chaperone IbpA